MADYLKHSHTLRWDIFCRVIDNFGDAGVAWRIARELTRRHGDEVTLMIDDVATLARIAPSVQAELRDQQADGVRVVRWDDEFSLLDGVNVVVEAFGAALPDRYLDGMARRVARGAARPVWINLEYLSAEPWVPSYHLRRSPHPRLPLTKHFFFPGFGVGTGGLLRETDYVSAPVEPSAPNQPLQVSFFCYHNPNVVGLLDAMARGPRAVKLIVPDGLVVPQVRAWLESRPDHGAVVIEIIPMTDQPGYDALLQRCDLNFVRGEDSFVRAQWAARPMVWQIYPQSEATHQVKLNAFLDRFCAHAGGRPIGCYRDFVTAWNAADGGVDVDWLSLWAAMIESLDCLRDHAQEWRSELAQGPELIEELVGFAEALLAQSQGSVPN